MYQTLLMQYMFVAIPDLIVWRYGGMVAGWKSFYIKTHHARNFNILTL